jgi:hypothetical protein
MRPGYEADLLMRTLITYGAILPPTLACLHGMVHGEITFTIEYF